MGSKNAKSRAHRALGNFHAYDHFVASITHIRPFILPGTSHHALYGILCRNGREAGFLGEAVAASLSASCNRRIWEARCGLDWRDYFICMGIVMCSLSRCVPLTPWLKVLLEQAPKSVNMSVRTAHRTRGFSLHETRTARSNLCQHVPAPETLETVPALLWACRANFEWKTLYTHRCLNTGLESRAAGKRKRRRGSQKRVHVYMTRQAALQNTNHSPSKFAPEVGGFEGLVSGGAGRRQNMAEVNAVLRSRQYV